MNVVPDHEQRSVIHAVDGYAFLSEHLTLAETRTAAFVNARRQALEAVQTHIQSQTHVKDFQITMDAIVTDAKGAVRVLEQKDYGVEDNSRYHVWIKAEVVYALTPRQPATALAKLMDTAAPLTVWVWSDKKQYRAGERITVFFQGNKDFYGRIVNHTTTGELIQLIPNSYRATNFFQAGKLYQIPSSDDQYVLQVAPPLGAERLIVYASERPFAAIATAGTRGGLWEYHGPREVLARESRRAVTVVGAAPGQSSSSDFYEAIWNFTTVK